MVDAFDDALEFRFQPVVGADVEIAAQQCVDRIVKILLGDVLLAGMKGAESSLILLFHPRNQIVYRILLWYRGGRWCLRVSRSLSRNLRLLRRGCLRRRGLSLTGGRRRRWCFSGSF